MGSQLFWLLFKVWIVISILYLVFKKKMYMEQESILKKVLLWILLIMVVAGNIFLIYGDIVELMEWEHLLKHWNACFQRVF